MSWKKASIRKLFNPESIAVIGASPRPESLGALTFRALTNYSGKKYLVNPRYQQIGGMKCYKSVLDVPDEIDLAILALGASHVLDVVRECTEKQAQSAIIFAAGFKELGGRGKKLQTELKRVANDGEIAIIGPNCLGAGNVRLDLNATFFPHPAPLEKGSVSVISQSGGVSGLMLYRASEAGVGISKFASIGNRVNVDFNDLLRYFRTDPETKVVCLFVEGTGDARLMYEEMRKTTNEKDVVVYKVGKTPASKKAALSHTGSLAGNATLYSAAFRQARTVEVDSIQEMMDSAKVLSVQKASESGKNVAVITHSLGIALIAAQKLEQHGMHLPDNPFLTVE
ncbi:MAG: CoA-binding protein [Promethearchaeia archaeon]